MCGVTAAANTPAAPHRAMRMRHAAASAKRWAEPTSRLQEKRRRGSPTIGDTLTNERDDHADDGQHTDSAVGVARANSSSTEARPPSENSALRDNEALSFHELGRRLRLLDVQLKRKQLTDKPARSVSTIMVGIVAALIGFIGNLIVTAMQARNAVDLEREKLQGSLVIESIKTGEPTAAAKNLEFLLKTGLLHDPGSRISQYLKQADQVPVLPAMAVEESVGQPLDALPAGHIQRSVAFAVGELQFASGNACTAFLIGRNLALTVAHCVVNQTNGKFALGFNSRSATPYVYPVVGVEEINHDLDYAILKISANPGDDYGFLKLGTTEPKSADDVVVVHHTRRAPLAISAGKILAVNEGDILYDCQTGPGAGGGPVVSASGEVLALHSGGAMFNGRMVKKGVRIGSILTQSALLRSKSSG